MKKRRYEFTKLDREKVVIEAECPSLAIKKFQMEYGDIYYRYLKCLKQAVIVMKLKKYKIYFHCCCWFGEACVHAFCIDEAITKFRDLRGHNLSITRVEECIQWRLIR